MFTRSLIYRIERALAKKWFFPLFFILLFILILENLSRNTVFYSPIFRTPENSQLVIGLIAERDRLNNVLLGDCQSPELISFREGRIGPLVDENNNAPSSPQASNNTQLPNISQDRPDVPSDHMRPDKLVEILEQSTVKVFTKGGWGSGFFITPDLIITNRHVIENQDTNSIFVTSKKLGPRPIKAEVVASTDDAIISKKDYAVLKAKVPTNNMVPLKIGQDPTALLPVIAAGYPGAAVQTDENAVTPEMVFSQGEVSVVQTQAVGPPLVIHTANMSPGSSGGPLVNRCGQLVGVNTFVKGVEDQFDSRELFSLAASSLKEFLKSKNISFSDVSICNPN